MMSKKDVYADGVFSRKYRMQALAAASVNIITFCNGISLGWFAPMLAKFQSPTETPLDFMVNVEESSWMGSLACLGGLTGNILFGVLTDLIGRKACIYLVALPHMCVWILVYFATNVEFLYAARFASGITGGGTWNVIPIFIGEIADPAIRGRITSLFTLTLNVGMLLGYVLSSHVPYHIIPVSVILLPVLFLLIETFFPETPIYLLRSGKEEQAKKSLGFYMNYRDSSKEETEQFNFKFEELKSAVKLQKSQPAATLRDYFTKRSMRAFGIGLTVIFFNNATGSYTLLSYMSSIFVAAKTKIHADTNTIIIGVVQILGAYIAIVLVDRFGRKILLMISTATTGLSLAAFGAYAYLVERTNVDLSALSTWLPLVLMALIILTANVGLIPVPAVLLVEILPPKIRAKGVTFCLCIFSVFAFIMLKSFPPLMDVFGLSTTIWVYGVFGGIGFFCITLLVPETRGRSMNTDEE